MVNVLSIVSYKILPPKFGGQKGIALFNENLSRHQHLICYTITGNNPSEASYEVINEMGTGKFRYINPGYFFTLRRIISDRKITCLVLEHPYLGWLGLLLRRFCGIKLVVHTHNIESERFRSTGKWWWKMLWRYERHTLRSANMVFCISESDREYFISKYGVKPERSAVITYGISWNLCPAALERMVAR
ncbi:MAG: glycosyltransferase, partial [Bacteroidota bacterium]|nr:glycosyltransferase [Bacteroidota bacterium]